MRQGGTNQGRCIHLTNFLLKFGLKTQNFFIRLLTTLKQSNKEVKIPIDRSTPSTKIHMRSLLEEASRISRVVIAKIAK